MNKFTSIFILLFSVFAQGSESVEWPNLGGIKFVAERIATEEDINLGAAVFLLQSEGENIGMPMSIEIPQYAIHSDVDTGEKSKVVIIQAEEANGQQLLGALIVTSDEFMVGLFNEFQLFGKTKPRSQ